MSPTVRSIAKRCLRFARRIASGFVWFSIGAFFLWAIGAIYWLTYLPPVLRTVLAGVYAIGVPVWIWRSRRITAGGTTNARAVVAASIGAVYLATLGIQPSNDRVWDPDHAHVADVQIENGQVTIQNFRNFRYRSESDYDSHFETKSFPVADIESVSLIVQKFTANEGLAHLFLSFGLRPEASEAAEYFSVSVEIRRELGETYSPLKGLYRVYELTHVIGDERDLIGVRTVHRPEDRVYLYRVNATPTQAQQLFQKFAHRIQSLHAQPQFYHSLLNNCANGITGLTYELTPEPINWLDSRIVLPGHAGQFAWETELVGDRAVGQTFEELETSSRIDQRAKDAGITESFSQDIRGID